MNELPSSAYGVMKLLPETKDQVNRFSVQLVNAVKEGEVNPLQLKALFKVMEKVSENVGVLIKEDILSEADKYSEKKFTAFGFEIEKAEVGTKYDYLVCRDPVYNQRLQIFTEAKKQLDERAEFLKSLKEPLTVVDDESGEVATIKPPTKKSESGLKFSMK
jgi:hypothetical protein